MKWLQLTPDQKERLIKLLKTSGIIVSLVSVVSLFIYYIVAGFNQSANVGSYGVLVLVCLFGIICFIEAARIYFQEL